VDGAYFDAPGTLVAPLTPSEVERTAVAPTRTSEEMAADSESQEEPAGVSSGGSGSSGVASASAVGSPKQRLPPHAGRRRALPRVTVVFASVEPGPDALPRAGGAAGDLCRAVHEGVSAVLLAALRVTPSGYLCRSQERDLKWMAAFAEPQARALSRWRAQRTAAVAAGSAATLAAHTNPEDHSSNSTRAF
jgi:hypothetical protein